MSDNPSRPLSRSVQNRFLSIFTVSFLIFLSLSIAVFGLVLLRAEQEHLVERIDQMATAQSAVLATSLWHLDYDRIEVVLQAIVADPDVIGATVFDETGSPMAAIDQRSGSKPDEGIAVRRDIRYVTQNDSVVIGELLLTYTAANLRAVLFRDVLYHTIFGLLMLAGALIIVRMINRNIVITPVSRLLDAVSRPREGAERPVVEWNANDEFGTLVRAFNDMQAREQDAEQALRAARDSLEERVRARTIDLENALLDAERANRAKSEFLAMMSHEFRTPLNAILGFSEMLRNNVFGPLGSDRYEDYAEDIHLSGERMLSLVNDVLDIAAIEAGKRTYDMRPMNVAEIVDECIRGVDMAAGSKGVAIIAETENDIGGLVADERSIRQILLNLLSNAVKFTEPGGRISVGAVRRDQGVAFTVSDQGIGIPEDMITRLTEPFTQAISNPHLSREGTGLGLSIVKSLIDAHEGSMKIDSTINEGTTVTVYIPSAPEETAG